MKFVTILAVALILLSCKSNKKTTNGSSNTFELVKIWETDTLLTTSESAIYDKANDAIYVSCINKGPRTKDGNGFIAKLSSEGSIKDLKWITGMHAPKGLGIFNDNLYIADIDEVIVADIPSGKITERIHFKDAGMLNDITIVSNGRLYVTDTDSNRIYTINDGNVAIFLNTGLNSPNGLLAEKDRLLLASMGYKALFTIDYNSKTKEVKTTDLNKADGIISIGNGRYIVSDWFGELFLIDKNFKATSVLKTSDENIGSADLGFIPDEKVVLVPTFHTNTLAAYKIK